MICKLALTLAIFFTGLRTPADDLVGSMPLPPAVSFSAHTYNNGSSQAFDRYDVTSTPRWGSATQSLNQGGLGYVLHQTEIWGEQKFFTFVVPQSSGMIYRGAGFARTGGLEKSVSPLGTLRELQAQERKGNVRWTVVDGSTLASFTTQTLEARPRTRYWSLRWKPTTEELRISSGWSQEQQITHDFVRWIDIGGGFRHPSIVNISYGDEPESFKKIAFCDQFKVVDPESPEPTPQYPEGASLLDLAKNQVPGAPSKPSSSGDQSRRSAKHQGGHLQGATIDSRVWIWLLLGAALAVALFLALRLKR